MRLTKFARSFDEREHVLSCVRYMLAGIDNACAHVHSIVVDPEWFADMAKLLDLNGVLVRHKKLGVGMSFESPTGSGRLYSFYPAKRK